jgi:hypothetical protein
MMLARVKPGYRWSIIQAFAGREYLKTEWREVPAGVLPQHPDLDFMGKSEQAAVVTEEVDGETIPDSLPHEEEETAVAPKVGRPKK